MPLVLGLAVTVSLWACGSDSGGGGQNDGGTGNDAAAGNDGGGQNDGGGNDGGGQNDASTGDPTCTITAPIDGTEMGFMATWTFIAQADDPEDGPLSGPSVQWLSDQLGAMGNGLSLDVVLDPPYVHQITCIATDSDGNTGQDTIMVNAYSPVAEIWHPGDGETRAAGPVPFTGRGFDYEDGQLPPASLLWMSSLDGQLTPGAGEDEENFTDSLSAGTNVITLTVTDLDANTDATSITLTMTP